MLYNLVLRSIGVLNFENSKVSGEKNLIEKIYPKLLSSRNPVIFDVGANKGDFAAKLFEQFITSQYHAFEPHPETFSKLISNTTGTKILCHNLALSDTKGELILYDRADINGSPHASLHKEVISHIHKKNVTETKVKVETLDEFCIANLIPAIDILKIDTEGNELRVLEGAKNMLSEKKVVCIQFEFNEMNIISKTFMRDIRKVLTGYELYRLLPDSLVKLTDYPVHSEIFAFQNILAVRSDIKF
ncbi:MAG: FkbM family methyltransferase [Ignavibacteriales bacterium]|nr:FkbM family methyltransferase [Ignavibacteriales bacterium]MCF8316740.1 FkbM family methyltransferase [Ignavibacteriales bacterium]MCF8436026.1 FkbM family methyltransferase [Ignavibacteriales bacterium]